MKTKQISIVLLLLIVFLNCFVCFPVYAESDESEEILEAAYQSYLIYDTLNGYNRFWEESIDESERFYLAFYQKDTVDFRNHGFYSKNSLLSFNSSQEVREWLDRYFEMDKDFWVFVDDEMGEFEVRQLVGCDMKYSVTCYIDAPRISLPLLMIIDGVVYTFDLHGREVGRVEAYPDFENAVVSYCDGKNATVELDIVEEDGLNCRIPATITLVKTSDGWEINGGTLFLHDSLIGGKWFKDPPPPQTGDNTVLYLAIAASALAAMTALVVRRKREEL